MCGIVGIGVRRGGQLSSETIRRMCDALLHRGPDESGMELRETVGLAMRRLAIIDVEGGQQPLFNEERSVRVVFNGEIYNYRELRAELRAKGHRFRSESDGEVLPHLWEEYGLGFLDRLDGMFAIALHDLSANTLLLARDQAGIKPLYYSLESDRIVFGSEVKAVLAAGGVDTEPDLAALGNFLTWEYVPSPGTLHRGIRKLPPASYLQLNLDSFDSRVVRWWHLSDRLRASQADSPVSPREWEDRLDVLIRDSVRRQLISDVPLGAFLSGGVDSSLVVAAMDDPHTFSIGFDDQSYNELQWSKRVAEAIGANHQTATIRPDALELFELLMNHMDDPIADSSIFPTYLVSKLAKESVTVALSGDGGDELFGGYESYVAQSLSRVWDRIPSLLRERAIGPLIRGLKPAPAKKGPVNMAKRFVEGLDHSPALGHARWRKFVSERLAEELFEPGAFHAIEHEVDQHILRSADEAPGRPGGVDQSLYVDFMTYLTDNCLVKTDRMSMACSLEVRVPFLSPDVITAAFSLPERLKVRRRQTKVLLKRVAARHVPRECVYRPKEGFSVPLKHWLQGEFRTLAGDLISAERLKRQGLFQPRTVQRLWEEHQAGSHNHSHVLWALVVYQDWRDRWAG